MTVLFFNIYLRTLELNIKKNLSKALSAYVKSNRALYLKYVDLLQIK